MAEETQKILNRITDKLKKGQPIHETLPGKGLLKIDQAVPFLLVYRHVGNENNAWLQGLAATESSYIIAADNKLLHCIVEAIVHHLYDRFNGFLLVEIWAARATDKPPFTIYVNQKSGNSVSKKFCVELNKISSYNWNKTSVIKRSADIKLPDAYQPLITEQVAEKSGITFLGVEVMPVFINRETGEPYPLLLRDLRAKYTIALRKSIFEFIRLHTTYSVSDFQMLGSTVIDETALQIDRELAAYSKLFDFLLLVTPVNVDEAWEAFKKTGYSQNPVFHYRPMPVDPELIKRRLYNLPVEEITDPTIAFLFRDKRKEIDKMLNMMQEREKEEFMLTSIQLFGPVTGQLLDVAKALLVAVPDPHHSADSEIITPEQFAQMATRELQWLRRQDENISDEVRIADDIEGILVSKGVLNISSEFTVSKKRAMPLLQHEIGTHVVTYYNGKAQPLELFSIGVPGYEELQEGLAVFAEYLCDGLTKSRMRTLAARVIAVHEMVSGKNFIETFHVLTEKYSFKERTAFNITMRVYRGGGLTKDAVYLKGLLNIIEYIKEGKDLKQLLVGKIRQDYLPVVQELIHRKILKEAIITPRFLHDEYAEKLEEVRLDGNIFKMVTG